MQLKWLAGGIQKALSACLFIAFRTDPICVCRQKCQWNQKGLLDEYRMGVGVAWSSHLLSAGLRNWLECQTDVFEWEAPAPWSQDSPARRILWPFHSKGEEGFSEYWDTYLYLNVFFFVWNSLRRGAESNNFLFISMHLTPILRLSLTLATAHAIILLCRIGYSDTTQLHKQGYTFCFS